MELRISPLGSSLLVRPDPVWKSSLLATPENAQHEHPQSGVIVEVGTHAGPEFSPGRRILLNMNAGYEYTVAGEKLVVVTTPEVRAFIDDEVPKHLEAADAPD